MMNIAIVLAAGKSERLNDISVPKQLYLLNNVPLFMYSVLTFNNLDDSYDRKNLIKKNENQRKYHSTKNLVSLKSINEKMIQNKVNNIIDHLLLENKKKTNENKKTTSYLFFPRKKAINPKEYIEVKLKKDPYEKESFNSFNEQVKALGGKALRNYLIDGIDDYSRNIKKYNKISFDFFSLYNYDNKNNNKEI